MNQLRAIAATVLVAAARRDTARIARRQARGLDTSADFARANARIAKAEQIIAKAVGR